jgi:hypothetical protein
MKRKKITTGRLTTTGKLTTLRYPMREAILAELERREWKAYKLVQAVKGKMSAQAVYDYIAGRSDMTGRLLSHLLEALSLEIRPKG